MKRRTIYARRAVVPAVALAAAGLVLAGCGSSGSTGKPASSSSKSSSHSSAASAFFPVAVGNTWVYKSSVPSVGEQGTVTNRMTAVVPVSGGQRVTMTDTFKTTDAPENVTKLTYIFHSNGSITYPIGQLAGSGVSISGGGVVWPPASALASGRPQESTLDIGFKSDGLSVKRTAHVTVRGAGSATVTVPAGTYHATVVEMTMTLSVDGFAVSVDVRTWVANGVGPVKSEATTDEDGTSHVASVQELKSFTAG
jgi:hypothetical protein